ncbi:Uncharacterised protein [Mycobacterium tuberculosis]|uniref:Uncharacterized protein n=2 Tax=Mycobacterium tuberculosis TaxID=1773 RepID=A0A916L7I0_MYCTX|nr:Uncharacterised protein [Mycobacterium tuberculosis]
MRDAVTKSGDRGVADPAHHRGNRRILTSFHRQQVEQAQEVRMLRLQAHQLGQLALGSLLDGPMGLIPGGYRGKEALRAALHHGGQHALFGAEVPVNRAGC